MSKETLELALDHIKKNQYSIEHSDTGSVVAEVCESCGKDKDKGHEPYCESALLICIIEKAIAQPEQEPVAWAVMKDGECVSVRRFEPAEMSEANDVQFVPLYAAPPQPKQEQESKIEKL